VEGNGLDSGAHSDGLALVADPVRLNTLRLLADSIEATTRDLARVGFASEATLRRHLKALVSLGLVNERRGESDGLTCGRPAARFSLEPGVRESLLALLGDLQQVPFP